MSQLLLMGYSQSGKTGYGTQVYGRILAQKSSLKFRGQPESLKLFQMALEAYERGEKPPRTTSAYDSMTLPLLNRHGQSIDLVLPDYDGEQLTRMIRDRAIEGNWISGFQESSAWMLFIRPSAINEPTTTMDAPPVAKEMKNPKPQAEINAPDNVNLRRLSSQIEMIELLQMWWWVRAGFAPIGTTSPRLAIMLSCFDEVNTELTPEFYFKQLCPLLEQFIRTVWADSAMRVYGLSSQGGSLDDPNFQHTFREAGAEKSGFLVLPNGEQKSDLTLPIDWLFGET